MITILAIAIIVISPLTGFLRFVANNIEEQKYVSIKKLGEVEIRFYPSATLATVTSRAGNYKELSYNGFRRIANYIFGQNNTGEKIAMTAPVHMNISEQGSSMSFVMPSDYNSKQLPKPTDPGVVIEKTQAEYVAAIRFSGFASDEAIRKYSEKLAETLQKNGIAAKGSFRYLGYDPPYRIISRRNEIIVGIQWEGDMLK